MGVKKKDYRLPLEAERFTDWPLRLIYSTGNREIFKIKKSAGISETHDISINSCVNGRASTLRLIRISRPPSIPRFVISIIVNSVYGMASRWLTANIRNETSKVVPLWAYRYTTTSIPWIFFTVWVVTATHHAHPTSVLRGNSLNAMSMFHGCHNTNVQHRMVTVNA